MLNRRRSYRPPPEVDNRSRLYNRLLQPPIAYAAAADTGKGQFSMDTISRLRNAIKKMIWHRRAGIMLFSAAISAALGAAILGAGTQAQASSNSYIYTQPGRPVAIALCQSGCGSALHPIFPPNGTIAHMVCWQDSGWMDGNYSSNRYFWVVIQGEPGEWFIHSSYVYYQTSVPHCP
jgi:hypothetical protein